MMAGRRKNYSTRGRGCGGGSRGGGSQLGRGSGASPSGGRQQGSGVGASHDDGN